MKKIPLLFFALVTLCAWTDAQKAEFSSIYTDAVKEEMQAWKVAQEYYYNTCLKELKGGTDVPPELSSSSMSCYVHKILEIVAPKSAAPIKLADMVDTWIKLANKYADGEITHSQMTERNLEAWIKYENEREEYFLSIAEDQRKKIIKEQNPNKNLDNYN
jgi:hypothetical protein